MVEIAGTGSGLSCYCRAVEVWERVRKKVRKQSKGNYKGIGLFLGIGHIACICLIQSTL